MVDQDSKSFNIVIVMGVLVMIGLFLLSYGLQGNDEESARGVESGPSPEGGPVTRVSNDLLPETQEKLSVTEFCRESSMGIRTLSDFEARWISDPLPPLNTPEQVSGYAFSDREAEDARQAERELTATLIQFAQISVATENDLAAERLYTALRDRFMTLAGLMSLVISLRDSSGYFHEAILDESLDFGFAETYNQALSELEEATLVLNENYDLVCGQ